MIQEIPGFDGFYAISDTGVVWTCRLLGGNERTRGRKGKWKLKAVVVDKSNHETVNLTDGVGHPRNYFVHRLVLETFKGPCPEGKMCRHLDGNPRNNNIKNLAWGTRKENSEDDRRHGKLAGYRCRGKKLTEQHRQKIRDGLMGKKRPASVREKISAGNKRAWASGGVRRRAKA